MFISITQLQVHFVRARSWAVHVRLRNIFNHASMNLLTCCILSFQAKTFGARGQPIAADAVHILSTCVDSPEAGTSRQHTITHIRTHTQTNTHTHTYTHAHTRTNSDQTHGHQSRHAPQSAVIRPSDE